MSQVSRKTRVAVVFGGRSSEHAISCVTAGAVMAAIDRDRYEVLPIGIARDGRWVLPPAGIRLAIEDGRLPEVTGDGSALALPFDPAAGGLMVVEPGRVPSTLGDVDVVLPLLHGPYGEDGTIQGMLDLVGVRYVGAGVLASAVGMDKGYMKLVWQARGLPVGPYALIGDREWRRERKRVVDEVKELGLADGRPVFVKPARAGSSMGITRVTTEDALEAAVEAAREHDPKVIVEAAVEGREIECGVLQGLDDGPPDASLPAEVTMAGGHDFYDFETKYLDSATSMTIPPDLPPAAIEEVRRIAVQAFEALDCEGLARVDFFYTPEGRWILNEINTMPGCTPTSAFPKMWAATGLDYPAMVDRLIQTALHRPTGLR
ncbi:MULTISPECIES: D-alanine--D-alanine ligase family protein [Actinomadura]|uniref:D-alanine--D-alanine ligase n=1 Tax=Actinomadura litoris TaxID=2678616 RepID=A0A7K1LC53_9ACTN|nr:MULTISPECIES: D-alanine--D-alanine ligase family protein [Actinomadura]MBT2213662.1 D-alanine--D-alanine ligase [Actinomadura sp. NEAU-AAG7]MUN42004.1 D-alanine--D-alanine ligase [Actinomadura litoris]